MRITITGAEGFLGRHLQARLLARGLREVTPVGRAMFHDPAALARAVARADVVIHLAGVNRGDPATVEDGNAAIARRLVSALDESHERRLLVYANSIHSGADSSYGRGKQAAERILTKWAVSNGTALIDIRYQNIFGEGGRPDYNSFVATFCSRLATGREPVIDIDRPIELLHAQDAADVIVQHLDYQGPTATIPTRGTPTTVRTVLEQLRVISSTYATGTYPDLTDPFILALFNTYRSYLYPQAYPFRLTEQRDGRGSFFEAIRSLGGQGQTSFSTTLPAQTRGNHFHLRKVERFLVLRGSARIAIRPVFGGETRTFDVCGDDPAFVDMPTLHAHNITNTGDLALYTLFWASELYNDSDPDTFPEPV